jgi:hypothetical protein
VRRDAIAFLGPAQRITALRDGARIAESLAGIALTAKDQLNPTAVTDSESTR